MRALFSTSVFIFLIVFLLGAGPLCAQVPSMEEANVLYQAENWQGAVEAYGSIARLEPKNARAQFRLGVSLHRLGKYLEALEAYEKAELNGVPAAIVGYNYAATYALLGDREQALERITTAVKDGSTQVNKLKSDPDLAGLRDDPRFEELVRQADVNARPCELLPEYGQFDFWVGEWEVTAGGQTAGENRIDKLVKGCMLFENWTSAGGGSGKSINYFDPGKRKWIQVWMDSGGELIEAEGELVDGSMDFRGKHTYRDGRIEQYRMKFTPLEGGKVRQFIEQSKDDGETWYVWFDGTYVPK